MLILRDRFPRDIALWLGRDGAQTEVLAGCWLFMNSGKAWHTQYIASTQEGRDRCATHLLFDKVIQEALERGVGFLSFGCSTEDEGRRVNRGLFEFKAGFGAGAVCHDTYRLRLAG
jgi:lipid II:glycine glycyltransferase (peptidoglycan interpeptide bridge formation enzyme)